MYTEPELLNERLERLAMVLDEIMPNCSPLVRDALELLKEQEAVEPEKFMDGQVQRYKCRKCGKRLLYASFAKDNYCSKCGQAVKW